MCILCVGGWVCCWIPLTNNLSHLLYKVGLNAGLSTVWGPVSKSECVSATVCMWLKCRPAHSMGLKASVYNLSHYPPASCLTSLYWCDAVPACFLFMYTLLNKPLAQSGSESSRFSTGLALVREWWQVKTFMSWRASKHFNYAWNRSLVGWSWRMCTKLKLCLVSKFESKTDKNKHNN